MRGDDSPTGCHVAFGLLSPVHEAFVYVFTILNSAQVSILEIVIGILLICLHIAKINDLGQLNCSLVLSLNRNRT